MKKDLTLEERYQIYIDLYVGLDEPKNDGSGTTVSGKRTMESFLCRKRANNFITEDGICYASKWLDEHNIPKQK
jgi:hypothetical protein